MRGFRDGPERVVPPWTASAAAGRPISLWATACEAGLWPTGTFTSAYAANRKVALQGIIDADPIAACVRELMSEHSSWMGSAADLLSISVERMGQAGDNAAWPTRGVMPFSALTMRLRAAN
jgi:hypothetical protein